MCNMLRNRITSFLGGLAILCLVAMVGLLIYHFWFIIPYFKYPAGVFGIISIILAILKPKKNETDN